jgi:hypothetical protein
MLRRGTVLWKEALVGEVLSTLITALMVAFGFVLVGLLRRGNPHSRLRHFESGHTASLPLDIEFRPDGSRLPATIPAGLNGRARVSCSKDRGLIKVRGGGMVPGFDDEFWSALTHAARDGSVRSLEQDGEVLLAVPMKYPPNGGILVALAQEDWAILESALLRSQDPSRPS